MSVAAVVLLAWFSTAVPVGVLIGRAAVVERGVDPEPAVDQGTGLGRHRRTR